MSLFRTDLALESTRDAGDRVPGVTVRELRLDGFAVTRVQVETREGADMLCKPIGTYITVDTGPLVRREDGAFQRASAVLADELRRLLPREGPVLAVGLGNPAITPDALGHLALKSVIVTRHLLESDTAEGFSGFRCVAAAEPGVLGTTGVESADVITALVEKVRPAAVIAIDALASRRVERLCATVQLSDTGIVPGSGVGNARSALTAETLGVPVIALGVPTVIDAATLAADLVRDGGGDADEEALRRSAGDMIVTPRDIDQRVRDMARLAGYAVNLSLHQGLTVADIDMFVG